MRGTRCSQANARCSLHCEIKPLGIETSTSYRQEQLVKEYRPQTETSRPLQGFEGRALGQARAWWTIESSSATDGLYL
ncbi:hypothetical protein AG1IA_05671 [Rhizoctonia solani AG-1 IA]|uniref:Uncharacterized protein n=1 Tax=Thanatephorus cucumeris (strain AG1-IA) TaxID=983506 RepID=L8WU42_THACA|nr:hypothetical protein AG1IA_05671 [Rhizoctonia solani AG-1 IA]